MVLAGKNGSFGSWMVLGFFYKVLSQHRDNFVNRLSQEKSILGRFCGEKIVYLVKTQRMDHHLSMSQIV